MKDGVEFCASEMTAGDIRRFESKFERAKNTNDCWLWKAGGRGVYGAFWVNGRNVSAHKVAFALAKGVAPALVHFCHTCDTPRCVNPNHIFKGDGTINNHDMRAKGREARLKGEQRGHAKLTDAAIPKIRKLYAEGKHSYSEIGTLFGVDHSIIYRIIKGKIWTHVP